ncbi:hypothetical protein PR048_010347 [Dryococelus australis]|uniref:Uncharacterized protein n=1 Tax=Dryococelus australis TaxID=614101 RepID=A0ABQ9I2H0_9NEOP|nr:hypothetical protein PR048_010347 [Dryococelus australis]
MAELLACSPPTRANRVRSLAGSLPDFRKWGSRRTMPLAGGDVAHENFEHILRLNILVPPPRQKSLKPMEPRWLSVSHQGEPGSIPGRVTPGFLHVRIVPDDATGWRVFSGISRFPLKSRLNLFTHSLHSLSETRVSGNLLGRASEITKATTGLRDDSFECLDDCATVRRQRSDEPPERRVAASLTNDRKVAGRPGVKEVLQQCEARAVLREHHPRVEMRTGHHGQIERASHAKKVQEEWSGKGDTLKSIKCLIASTRQAPDPSCLWVNTMLVSALSPGSTRPLESAKAKASESTAGLWQLFAPPRWWIGDLQALWWLGIFKYIRGPTGRFISAVVVDVGNLGNSVRDGEVHPAETCKV